jgi:hypothetical protein
MGAACRTVPVATMAGTDAPGTTHVIEARSGVRVSVPVQAHSALIASAGRNEGGGCTPLALLQGRLCSFAISPGHRTSHLQAGFQGVTHQSSCGVFLRYPHADRSEPCCVIEPSQDCSIMLIQILILVWFTWFLNIESDTRVQLACYKPAGEWPPRKVSALPAVAPDWTPNCASLLVGLAAVTEPHCDAATSSSLSLEAVPRSLVARPTPPKLLLAASGGRSGSCPVAASFRVMTTCFPAAVHQVDYRSADTNQHKESKAGMPTS